MGRELSTRRTLSLGRRKFGVGGPAEGATMVITLCGGTTLNSLSTVGRLHSVMDRGSSRGPASGEAIVVVSSVQSWSIGRYKQQV